MKSTRFLAVVLAVIACAFTAVGNVNAQQHELTVGDTGTSFKLIQMGRATFAAGVAVVANTKVTANSNIVVFRQTAAGTVGVTAIVTRSAGTSFTITSKAADGTTTATSDTSVVGWWLYEP